MSVHAPGQEIEMTSLSKRGGAHDMNSDFSGKVNRPNTQHAFGEAPVASHQLIGSVPRTSHELLDSEPVASHQMLGSEPSAAPASGGGFLSSVGSWLSGAASKAKSFFGGIGSSISGLFGGGSKKPATQAEDQGIEMAPMGSAKQAYPSVPVKAAPENRARLGLEFSPMREHSGVTQESVDQVTAGFRRDAKNRMATGDSTLDKLAVSTASAVDAQRSKDAATKAEGEATYGKYGNAAKSFAVNSGVKALTGVDMHATKSLALNAADIASETAIRNEDGLATAEQVAQNQATRRDNDRMRAEDALRNTKSVGAKWKASLPTLKAHREAIKAQGTLQAIKQARGTVDEGSAHALTEEQQEMVHDGRAAEPITMGEHVAHAVNKGASGLSTMANVAIANPDHTARMIEKAKREGTSLKEATAMTAVGGAKTVASTTAHFLTGGASSTAGIITDAITGTNMLGGASDLVGSAASSLTESADTSYGAKKGQQEIDAGGRAAGTHVRGLIKPEKALDVPSSGLTTMERVGNAGSAALGTSQGKAVEESAIAYGKKAMSSAANGTAKFLEHLTS